ncbi:hypothetical protein CYMTET_31231, partial [Cymbomonas tetramitiformis]
DLRGSVRVFCRVRPMPSRAGGDPSTLTCQPDECSVHLNHDSKPHPFSFDRCFGPVANQEQVFNEVSDLVQSALDGYKVCLFSYGQTGAGKTHTMLGSGTGVERGVVPRSVDKILQEAKKQRAQGWEFSMEASYIEIYNENFRDLLSTGTALPANNAVQHQDGFTMVAGSVREPVDSVEAAAGLVRRANSARIVQATQMNAESSRSHTVFMLYIRGTHAETNTSLKGALNLVDLAGSERLARSGAEGDRAKEACSINKSLSCLGDVFAAIGSKSSHVPYRNSKLTYLLQPCLGGEGKTLMFVNLNPEPASSQESLCSLRFAAQVNACELGGGGRKGGAKRNVTSMSGPDPAEQVQEKPSKASATGKTSTLPGAAGKTSILPGGVKRKVGASSSSASQADKKVRSR